MKHKSVLPNKDLTSFQHSKTNKGASTVVLLQSAIHKLYDRNDKCAEVALKQNYDDVLFELRLIEKLMSRKQIKCVITFIYSYHMNVKVTH